MGKLKLGRNGLFKRNKKTKKGGTTCHALSGRFEINQFFTSIKIGIKNPHMFGGISVAVCNKDHKNEPILWTG